MAGEETPGAVRTRVPATAHAIVDLLNSRAHATPLLPDTLDDPGTAIPILSPFGQPDGMAPSTGQLAQIRALRSDLMTVVASAGAAGSAQGWTGLTHHASTVRFEQIFSGLGEVRQRPVDGDPVVGAIVLTVAGLITAGTLPRVRVCANELCNHVFYDMTRSRTQRWHSYDTCGNRSNVAAHRARKTPLAARGRQRSVS